MKIKKVISILLIILSTFSLTACNSKEVRNYVPKVENESMTDV